MSYIDKINFSGTAYDVRDAASDAMIPAYDAENGVYAVGEYCRNGNTIYKCATAVTAAEAFDSTKWTAVTVGAALSQLSDDIGDLKSAVGELVITPNWQQGNINSSGQIVANDSVKYTATAIKVYKGNTYTIENGNTIYRIKYYANEPTIGTTWPTSQTSSDQTSYTPDDDGWVALVTYNNSIGNVYRELSSRETLLAVGSRVDVLEADTSTLQTKVASLEEHNDIEDIKNPVTFTNDTCYKAGYTLGSNTVGNDVAMVANSARNVCREIITDNAVALNIMYAVGSDGVSAVVTDNANKVLKIYTATETTRRMLRVVWNDVSNAKYVYWSSLSNKNIRSLYEFENEYVICKGLRIPATVTGGTICADLIKGENAVKFDISGTNNVITFDYNEQDGDFTSGVWIKVPKYSDIQNITDITMKIFLNSTTQINTVSFKSNFLQMGEWTFIKLPMINGNLTHNKTTLTFTVATGTTPVVLVSPFIVTNNYIKPTFIMNNDQFWGASETCGFYNYMITNKVPFTVTGKNSVDDPPSAQMQETLYNQYVSGLLDVGIYTNELPNTYPIANNATSYIEVQNAMSHIIDSKIQDGYYPASIGCGNHLMPPAIRKSIEESKFTAIRAGFANGDRLGVLSNYPGAMYQTGDIISYLLRLGGICFMFAHGFSSNPGAEFNPSLYSNWTVFKDRMDNVIEMRDRGDVVCVNMKQWAEMTKGLELV